MSVIYNGVTYAAADSHTHIYPQKIAEKATGSVGEFYDIEMHNIGLSSVLLEKGKAAGFDKFLVCSVATKVEQVRSINSFIEAECREHEEFLGLGAWHQDIDDVEAELEDILARNLVGIKLHPDFQKFNIDDPKMLPVYREAANRKLPVLFHMGDSRMDFSAPERLMNVIEKIPDIICVAAHLGGYSRWDDAVKALRGTNVYIDTSSSFPFINNDTAVRNIEHFGIDRTMFGTDFPMWNHKEELERFFSLGFTEEQNRKILYSNFEKLFLRRA